MNRFSKMRTLQSFSPLHASLHNQLNQDRHLTSGPTFEVSAPPP